MAANMTNAMQEKTSPSIEYITTLSVYLQRADEDSGLYTVTFNISSAGDFIIGFSATESRSIVVLCELYNRLGALNPGQGMVCRSLLCMRSASGVM